jgi:hypothetical protein
VIFIPVTVFRVPVTVDLKEPFLGWRSKYQDSATPHTAKVEIDALTEIGGTPLEHPPYSPDLSPCDFWAFPTTKREIRNRLFHYPHEAWGKRFAAHFREAGGAL